MIFKCTVVTLPFEREQTKGMLESVHLLLGETVGMNMRHYLLPEVLLHRFPGPKRVSYSSLCRIILKKEQVKSVLALFFSPQITLNEYRENH
jgi:hypothetical protein